MNNIKGIYKILNKVNNKFYIGSSTCSFRKRWTEHKSALNRNVHHNSYLQKSWNKYGSDNFEFMIIEEVIDIKLIIIREQFYLDTLQPFNKIGYNNCTIAGNTLGVKLSNEHRLKLSNIAKARVGDKNPFYGKKHSKESILLMIKNKENKPVKPKRKILQLDLNDNIIKLWDGAYDAAKELKLNQSGINFVVNGKRKTHGNFKWVYKLD